MKTLCSLCLILFAAVRVFAQSAPAPTEQQTKVVRQQMPVSWQMQMGLRSYQVRARIAIVDKVVLVPDAATYLDEISRWTLRGRWPVLIEDDFFSPMFVRAFKPSKVIRRTSIGAMPATIEEKNALAKNAASSLFHSSMLAGSAWMPPGIQG